MDERDVAGRLAALEERVGELCDLLRSYAALLPDPASVPGRLLARKVRRALEAERDIETAWGVRNG